MTKRMLVDAAHPEQVRVVVAKDDFIEEFDVETTGKEQIKGNIYVGEIARVEPSLQAAFIDYGGNRNGFLAFGEVHPSFFNIPAKEKKELLKELEDIAARRRKQEDEEDAKEELDHAKLADNAELAEVADGDELSKEEMEEDARAIAIANALMEEYENGGKPGLDDKDGKDEKTERKAPIHKRYDIQNVLKEGQKILIQVVKEERGTKGAALTTYFTMPGRFTVLMPNTPYAGGISRKITDFKKL